jgi:6-phosphogluconolactonase
MKAALLSLAATLLTAHALAGDDYWVYFGTNTNAKNGSQGIYVARFNTQSGQLTEPIVAAQAGNPGFLAIHPSRKHLLAIGDYAELDGKKAGGIASYAMDAKTGLLTLVSSQSSVGQGPCHVNVDATGRMAALANYSSGSVASYAVKSDGTLSEPVSFIQHTGSSIDPKRQTSPHAHSVNFSPDNRFAFACDLGTDQVLIYKVEPETGKLTPNDPPYAKTPAGGGPRHLAFHPSGKFVFVNNEMAMTVTTFAYDAARGALTEVDTVSTLPEADRGKAGFSTAEVLVHPSGKTVYVSNRTHDTVAVLSCDEQTGKLTLVQNVPVEGMIPRNICLAPGGRWLIAAHQNSGTAAVFRVAEADGQLSFTGAKVKAPGAICVRFVPVE